MALGLPLTGSDSQMQAIDAARTAGSFMVQPKSETHRARSPAPSKDDSNAPPRR